MTTRNTSVFPLWALLVLAASTPAFAQSTTPPTDSMSGLLRFVGYQLGGEQSARVLSALAGLAVSTAPLGTSTGAFTWVSDPTVGLKTHAASSFGPTFGERALTSGRGSYAAGFNLLHADYGRFAGQPLTGEGFKLVQNADIEFSPLWYSALNLKLSSQTAVFFGTAGLRDDLDVGIAVPLIRVSFDAVGGGFTTAGDKFQEASVREAWASGLGDMAVFAKYRFWKQPEGGAAVELEVRLPTGSKDNLRGLGVSRTQISAIWSRGGTWSPHVKLGYEIWSAGVPVSGAFALGGSTVSAGEVAVKNQIAYRSASTMTPIRGRRSYSILSDESFKAEAKSDISASHRRDSASTCLSVFPRASARSRWPLA